jgi:hypothetical protein
MKIFSAYNIRSTVAITVFSMGIFTASIFSVYAQDGTSTTTASGVSTSTSPVINLNLVNPIAGTVDSIPQFFQTLISIIIKIAIPFVAIVLVYCGLLFVTARGDAAQIEKARSAFTYAVIGGLVLLASWLIAEAIRDALTSLAYVI